MTCSCHSLEAPKRRHDAPSIASAGSSASSCSLGPSVAGRGGSGGAGVLRTERKRAPRRSSHGRHDAVRHCGTAAAGRVTCGFSSSSASSRPDARMGKPAMRAGEPVSKRVKLAHDQRNSNNSSATVQRRLRKMSLELAPSHCSFEAQARVLCVGTAVVYRVVLSLTAACGASGQTTPTWIMAMSQAKFRGFVAQARAILQQPAVQHYYLEAEVEWRPFRGFLSALSAALSRYEHLQTAAFAIQADAETMQAGRLELERFLAACWRAVELLLPALTVEPYLPASLGRQVGALYVLVHDLLALPADVLDASCAYANAVLRLEDVAELLPSLAEHVCSICLESLATQPARELRAAGRRSNEEDDESPSRRPGDSECAVKLPCTHVFHEDCVMAWLRHNPSCPECRAGLGGAT